MFDKRSQSIYTGQTDEQEITMKIFDGAGDAIPTVSRSEWADWDLPAPYLTLLAVARADIDAYDHVNNAVYVTWFDRAAWEHSAALGLPIEKCLQLDRGMAVVRSVIAYLRPAVLGDTIHVATWLLPADGKLRVRRRFQVRRESDGATLARAEIEYACIVLSSGRPARWPPEFHERYVALDEVARAGETLAPI
jgi:acyl-CoA thioester hydrolase